MLPYSPLHHLLLADVGATLVMTSANVSDEPIAYRDDGRARAAAPGSPTCSASTTGRSRCAPTTRSLRALDPGLRPAPLLLRRSRGYVPRSVDLPLAAPPLLACGAELKSTFCVAKGRRAWVGHHIGDLKNLETLTLVSRRDRALRAPVRGRARGRRARPPSRLPLDPLRARARGRRARRRPAPPCPPRRLPRRARRRRGPPSARSTTAAATGSTGRCGAASCWSAASPASSAPGALFAVRLPGGDRAVAEPWRMACAWLAAASGDDVPEHPRHAARGRRRAAGRRSPSSRAAASASPLTTSAGRLFDAVAAICGIRASVNYEGQAAAELEAASALGRARRLPDAADRRRIGRAVAGRRARRARDGRGRRRRRSRRAPTSRRSAPAFTTRSPPPPPRRARARRERRGLATAVLSGGVFQNRLLLERTAALLRAAGLTVLVAASACRRTTAASRTARRPSRQPPRRGNERASRTGSDQPALRRQHPEPLCVGDDASRARARSRARPRSSASRRRAPPMRARRRRRAGSGPQPAASRSASARPSTSSVVSSPKGR